MNSEEA